MGCCGPGVAAEDDSHAVPLPPVCASAREPRNVAVAGSWCVPRPPKSARQSLALPVPPLITPSPSEVTVPVLTPFFPSCTTVLPLRRPPQAFYSRPLSPRFRRDHGVTNIKLCRIPTPAQVFFPPSCRPSQLLSSRSGGYRSRSPGNFRPADDPDSQRSTPSQTGEGLSMNNSSNLLKSSPASGRSIWRLSALPTPVGMGLFWLHRHTSRGFHI